MSRDEQDHAVRIRDVRLSLGGHKILKGVDLDLGRSEIIAVFGPSGTGKSTLLRTLTGELVPESGEISVLGVDPSRCSNKDLLALRRRLGVQLQGNGLLSDLTVFENIALPLRAHTKLDKGEIKDKVMESLEAVGLGDRAQVAAPDLSGGMARRVAFARATIMKPELMLFDEPLTGLDPASLSQVRRLIWDQAHVHGAACLVITHHVNELFHWVDKALLMLEGKVAACDRPEAILKHSNPEVREFFAAALENDPPETEQADNEVQRV